MIHVERRGQGPALVLVHGITESHHSFDPLYDALASSYDVTAIDLRGHGQSTREGPFDVLTMALDLRGVLESEALADAVLVAPTAGTVRTRLLEPGDMASPQTPVLSLAITDPKWVRVYADETDLPLIHPGQKAWVEVDGLPKHRFAGWVGFISPEAEFTPKSVETAQLRTSLVYEVRIFVKDPHDDLRLGMPATVIVPLARPLQ